MINWRSIVDVGYPTNGDIRYLVTDGKDISVSDVEGHIYYSEGVRLFTFKNWGGDENTWEDNSCCSGTRKFEMKPTHWCPISEIVLP